MPKQKRRPARGGESERDHAAKLIGSDHTDTLPSKQDTALAAAFARALTRRKVARQ